MRQILSGCMDLVYCWAAGWFLLWAMDLWDRDAPLAGGFLAGLAVFWAVEAHRRMTKKG